MIHAADSKRVATSMEELEWMLSKAAVYNASYGMLIDLQPVPGALPEMLSTIKQWNGLTRSGAFTASQKEVMRDPYLDWHLERQTDSLFLLHPMNFSRRYQCNLQLVDTGLLQSDTWMWNVEDEVRFGLRIQVEGEAEISNPMINTDKGLVMFPCMLKPGQRLFYDFADTAYVVDANSNVMEVVAAEGVSELARGNNEVVFLCEVDPSVEKIPVIWLRYITREQPLLIHPYK